MASWFEDESFWAGFHDVLFGPARWERTAASADGILSLAPTVEGGRILDLCCGPGRFALEFARRGYRVTGVDRTATYVEEARQRAVGEQLAIEFVIEDMRRFRREGEFDLALNLFTSFGYFDDPADDLLVARNLCACLKPGGRLVMDLIGKEVLARTFRAQDASWVDPEKTVLMLEERVLRDGWDRIETTWTVFRETERLRRTFALRLYSGRELAELLRQAGFTEVAIHGGLDGSAYDHQAGRLVAIASKGEGM